MKKFDPLTIIGKRYGKLVVKEYLGKEKRHHKYLCQCDCGNAREVFRDNLIGKKPTESCGNCWRVEDENDYLRYFCSNGDSFLLDKQDYKLAWKYRWFINKQGYATTNINGRTEKFSRLVLGVNDSCVVDHINRNTRDNRRANLRVANRMENARNEAVRVINKCGFKGVSLHKCGKYRADIGVEGKILYLGLFYTAEEAALAYDEAARKYHKEFARVNFPKVGEQGCREASAV